MNRRRWVEMTCIGLLCLACVPAIAQQPKPAARGDVSSLAVVDFELIDEQNNPATEAAQQMRLREATAQLQQELAQYKLYQIADSQPSSELQHKLRSQQAYLYRCDDCAEQIGRLLGVDLVMVTWVQKVSELILNLNVQIYDVQAQKVVFVKSVDMRGNTDASWRRAVHYLVRDMAEKRERNSAYAR